MPEGLGIRYGTTSSNQLGDAWGGFKKVIQSGGDAAINATVDFGRNFIQGMMDDEAEAVEKRKAGGWTQKLQELQDTAGIMLEGATAGPLDLAAEGLIQGSNYLPEQLKTPAIAAGLLLGSVDGTVPKVNPKVLKKLGLKAPKLTKHSDDLVKWYLKGDMSPKLREATKSINPQGYKIWQGNYKDYKALSARELKSSVNRSGMSPKKFKEKYGVPIYEHRGELKLGSAKSHDVQITQKRGGANRLGRQEPPTDEELLPLFEELGIPKELRKEYRRYSKTGFRQQQKIASDLTKQTGEYHNAGHPFPLNYWGDPLEPGVVKMKTSPTGGLTNPEKAYGKGGERLKFGIETGEGNIPKGGSGAVNRHAARMAGLPETWEDDIALWWARRNNISELPDWKGDWTNEQRELILSIREDWEAPKVEVMMEKIEGLSDANRSQIPEIMKELEKQNQTEHWMNLSDYN